MTTGPTNRVDESTATQKVAASMGGFGFACLAFFFSAVILIPITGSLASALAIPDAITVALVLLELFGLTVAAGIWGVAFVARGFVSSPCEVNS